MLYIERKNSKLLYLFKIIYLTTITITIKKSYKELDNEHNAVVLDANKYINFIF